MNEPQIIREYEARLYAESAVRACRAAGLTRKALDGGTVVEMIEAAQHYAACGDGCTCGDGWSHDAAKAVLAKCGGGI